MRDFDNIYRIEGSILIKGKDAMDAYAKKMVASLHRWPLVEQWDCLNEDGVVQWKVIN